MRKIKAKGNKYTGKKTGQRGRGKKELDKERIK
jgi:hypothetical protein